MSCSRTAYWLRVPVGKLHTDRYIPLHPQLKAMFDDWLARRPPELRSDRLSSSAAGPSGLLGSTGR